MIILLYVTIGFAMFSLINLLCTRRVKHCGVISNVRNAMRFGMVITQVVVSCSSGENMLLNVHSGCVTDAGDTCNVIVKSSCASPNLHRYYIGVNYRIYPATLVERRP